MGYRSYVLESGTIILLGKNAENNDELVREFEGKENVMFHTAKPGSPFCVIDNLEPSKKDISDSATACAAKSQDWRDNKNDVEVHQFTGNDVSKDGVRKIGTWKLKTEPKVLKIKKSEILKWEEIYRKQDERE